MRLLFIADGRSIHTLRWVEYFAKNGHEVHLATYDPMNHPILGVTEHLLDSSWDNLYLAFLPRHIHIRKIIKEIHPDLIHAHFISKYGFHLVGLEFSPTIVSAWGDDVLILPEKSRFIHWYTKKVLNSVNLIYAISQNIKNEIIRNFSITPAKIKYLPFGVDTEIFSPNTLENNQHRDTIEIFTNRGYLPVYDNETLLKGFALAFREEPRLRLTLKGDGPEEDKLRNLVESLEISDYITFRKRTDYSQVPRDYHLADIFITTSISDGTPVSILEAMASGLPCIASSIGGIPEWIEDGVTGLLIKPGSPEQVARAILTLAEDPVLRRKIGTTAREVVVSKGSWNGLMEQAEKDYQDLIKTYNRDLP